jgi:hypothetical protein
MGARTAEPGPYTLARYATDAAAARESDCDSSTGSSGGSERGWRGAFASKSGVDFAAAFAPEVILQASTLVTPVRGRDQVARVMAAASGIYQELEFTHQARAGARTYLEWRAGGVRRRRAGRDHCVGRGRGRADR